MNLRKGLVAAAIGTGIAVSATACGPGYPQAEYCVDNAGHVMPANYCQPSYPGYGSYFVYMGYVHNHTYAVGAVIPRSYIASGRQVRANDTAGRQRAGIPVTSSFTNGGKVTGKAATSQVGPKSPSVSTSPTKKTTTTTRTPSTTVNRTTPRSSGGFSSGSSSRSSGRSR